MRNFKKQIIKHISSLMALFVFLISSGFTYHWEVCVHSDSNIICSASQSSSSCCLFSEQLSCCSEAGDKSCDVNFSSFIQFNFEAIFLSIDHKTLFRNATNRIVAWSLQPDKNTLSQCKRLISSLPLQALRRTQIQRFLL
jgi:hypothetical protein